MNEHRDTVSLKSGDKGAASLLDGHAKSSEIRSLPRWRLDSRIIAGARSCYSVIAGVFVSRDTENGCAERVALNESVVPTHDQWREWADGLPPEDAAFARHTLDYDERSDSKPALTSL